jgi:hypothetical protein
MQRPFAGKQFCPIGVNVVRSAGKKGDDPGNNRRIYVAAFDFQRTLRFLSDFKAPEKKRDQGKFFIDPGKKNRPVLDADR